MTRAEFNKAMNSIAIDSMVLIIFILIGLIAIGTKIESGDVNAGGMLSVVYMPALLPLVPLSLGLIKFTERLLKYNRHWIASLTPMFLIAGIFWLKPFDAYFLFAVIAVVSFYSILKLIFIQLT